jgi:hypothetical protein
MTSNIAILNNAANGTGFNIWWPGSLPSTKTEYLERRARVAIALENATTKEEQVQVSEGLSLLLDQAKDRWILAPYVEIEKPPIQLNLLRNPMLLKRAAVGCQGAIDLLAKESARLAAVAE